MDIKNYRTNLWQGIQHFSEQMIMDCSGGGSCDGGSTAVALYYWMVPYEIRMVLASDYPYIHAEDIAPWDISSCMWAYKPKFEAVATSFSQMAGGTAGIPIDSMLSQFNLYGPFITYLAIDTSLATGVWKTYAGGEPGIMNNTCCYRGDGSYGSLNHSVVVVGWGITTGQSYWIYRNSHGSSWGINGYMKATMTTSGLGVCGGQQLIESITVRVNTQ